MMAPLRRLGWALAMALILPACEQERDIPTIDSDTVRPIKTMVVAEPSRGREQRFAGVVEAAETTRLSFEISGTVQEVAVEEGQRVTEGEVIARLDAEPYRLALENAKAKLDEALKERADAKDTYQRRAELVESGAISEQKFTRARTSYEQTQATVEAARTDVQIAQRDLRHTRMEAPFAGTVASRDVEAYEEVGAGQPLFTLNSEGGINIAVSVPESIIARIASGRSAELTIPTAGLRGLPGRVTEVAGSAAEGGVYPVTVAPSSPTPGVEPGMTGEVTFTFKDDGPPTFRVPVSAVRPHPDGSPKAYVFTHDADNGTVARTEVRTRGISGNSIAVAEGLSKGDVIATAGVNQLRDGQSVKLLRQQTADPE